MTSPVNTSTSSPYTTQQIQNQNTQNSKQSVQYAEKTKNVADNAPIVTTSNTSNVSSKSFKALLDAQENAAHTNTRSKTSSMTAQTIGGPTNLDEYFNTPKNTSGKFRLEDSADQILLPTTENVKALTKHVNERFNALLTEYNIPSAPSQITYNNAGQMELPEDYAYKEELLIALEENPGLERELGTLNALTSHASALERSMAFNEEYSRTTTKAQADAIIAKYSDLFAKHKEYSEIALSFSTDGKLSMTVDGKEYSYG